MLNLICGFVVSCKYKAFIYNAKSWASLVYFAISLLISDIDKVILLFLSSNITVPFPSISKCQNTPLLPIILLYCFTFSCCSLIIFFNCLYLTLFLSSISLISLYKACKYSSAFFLSFIAFSFCSFALFNSCSFSLISSFSCFAIFLSVVLFSSSLNFFNSILIVCSFVSS